MWYNQHLAPVTASQKSHCIPISTRSFLKLATQWSFCIGKARWIRCFLEKEPYNIASSWRCYLCLSFGSDPQKPKRFKETLLLIALLKDLDTWRCQMLVLSFCQFYMTCRSHMVSWHGSDSPSVSWRLQRQSPVSMMKDHKKRTNRCWKYVGKVDHW